MFADVFGTPVRLFGDLVFGISAEPSERFWWASHGPMFFSFLLQNRASPDPQLILFSLGGTPEGDTFFKVVYNGEALNLMPLHVLCFLFRRNTLYCPIHL